MTTAIFMRTRSQSRECRVVKAGMVFPEWIVADDHPPGNADIAKVQLAAQRPARHQQMPRLQRGKGDRVSEAALQFLISEIMAYKAPLEKEAKDTVLDEAVLVAKTQRIENMGYEIGYRLAEKLTADQKFLSFAELDFDSNTVVTSITVCP